MAEAQLTLALQGAARYRRGDFLPAPSNAAARHWLAHQETWPRGRLILFGPPGCGKTHLARGWAGDDAMWLAGGTLPAPEGPGRVVVDDADRAVDETALFHLINACEAAGAALLLTGAVAPARWGTRLADLVSRLRASQAVEIAAPEDALLRALLARLLAERQLAVSAQTQDWLLARLPRTTGAIGAAAARLDSASLARHQPITRVLARAALGDLLNDGQG